MRSLRLVLGLPALIGLACNDAPVDYLLGEPAPGSNVSWDAPTDAACDNRNDPEAFEVNGFTFCGADNNIRPIDQPIHLPCAEVELPGETDVFWATDGLTARAWPIALLRGRELVHEDWPLGPVLVDW